MLVLGFLGRLGVDFLDDEWVNRAFFEGQVCGQRRFEIAHEALAFGAFLRVGKLLEERLDVAVIEFE